MARVIQDTEGLAIIAGLAVVAYIAYRIYQDKQALTNSPTGQVAGALTQAAYNTATGEVAVDNPIAHGLSELWTAVTDPFGNTLATQPSTDPAMQLIQANQGS
jgi:hypothetical protein